MKANFDKHPKLLRPLCPYCYDGEIVMKEITKIFICFSCRREIEIEVEYG